MDAEILIFIRTDGADGRSTLYNYGLPDLALSAKGVAERMNSLELKAEGGTLLARAYLPVKENNQ